MNKHVFYLLSIHWLASTTIIKVASISHANSQSAFLNSILFSPIFYSEFIYY
jgi:hypothetical protein